MEVGAQRLWPSCAAAVVVIAALTALLAPGLSVAAPSEPGGTVNPVRVALSPARGALGGPPLAPDVASYRSVAVHNTGTVAFRYATRVRASGELAGVVELELRAVAGDCDAAAFAASGDVVAGPAPLDRIAPHALRLLEPGGTERLCARVLLPARHDLARPGARTDSTLVVTAVQA